MVVYSAKGDYSVIDIPEFGSHHRLFPLKEAAGELICSNVPVVSVDFP